jgi:hypothetical protein
MEKLDVTAGDSRDNFKREKFFFADWNYALFPAPHGTDWTSDYPYYGQIPGFNCCSNHAVAFHYVKPREMVAYEYFIYHLRPFGVIDLPQPLPGQVSFERVAEVNRVLSTTTQKTKSTTTSVTTSTPVVTEVITIIVLHNQRQKQRRKQRPIQSKNRRQ